MNFSRVARLFACTLTTAALTCTGLAVTAPAAHAGEGGSYDIVRITSRNVVVNSSSCRYVPVSITLRNSPYGGETSFSADMEVWRGVKHTGSLSFWDDFTSWSSSTTLRDHYFYCPYEGFGTFRLGPSEVDAETYSSSSYATLDSDLFRDNTRGYFVAKQASSSGLAVTKVYRKPALRSFSVRPRYFSEYASSWSPWRYKAVSLQRYTSAGWKHVKSVKTDRRGIGTVRLYAKRGQRWRVVTPATSTIWGSTSPVRSTP